MADAVMADGGCDIASRFFRPSAMTICFRAARLHVGSTFACGQHVCIWAARLHLRHREAVQSFNAAGDRTLVGFRRSTRAEEMLEIVACA